MTNSTPASPADIFSALVATELPAALRTVEDEKNERDRKFQAKIELDKAQRKALFDEHRPMIEGLKELLTELKAPMGLIFKETIGWPRIYFKGGADFTILPDQIYPDPDSGPNFQNISCTALERGGKGLEIVLMVINSRKSAFSFHFHSSFDRDGKILKSAEGSRVALIMAQDPDFDRDTCGPLYLSEVKRYDEKTKIENPDDAVKVLFDWLVKTDPERMTAYGAQGKPFVPKPV